MATNMESYILRGNILRKIFICILLTLVCFFGCTNYNSNEYSGFSNINTEKEINTPPFYEDDVSVKLLNNGSLTNVHSSSPTIYVNDNNTYITCTKENKLYCYSSDGEKSFLADNARKCFSMDGIMYCELWEGTSVSERKLACFSNNELVILVDNCTFTYGKNGIYYKINGENKLYLLSYNTHETTFVTDIQKGYYFNIEYNGFLWFYGPDGLYCSLLDGSEMKLIIPECYNVLGYRNNYIFFGMDNKLFKFSILTNESVDMEIPLINVHACNFTDNLCLIADESGLFSFDSNFLVKRKIITDNHIHSICVLNNMIIIGSVDEYGNDFYRCINEDGEILNTFS